MLPNNQKQRYDTIKKLTYCGPIPVLSQCVLSKTVSGKKLMSACTKIAMQIVVKLGGALWHAEPCGIFSSAMTVGLDVYHQRGQNSILGYVAALTPGQDRFYSKAFVQCEREENMNQLHQPTVHALQAYYQLHGRYPNNIVVFRDGVGDGQLPLVRSHECAQFLDAIQATASHKIGLTFMVIQKRVSQRFYLNTGPGSYENPRPGTIIDDVVTRKKWCDFYLCSQSVNQGTVTPTHFNLIYDTANVGKGFDIDLLQRYAYINTHMYYNWPGTVRVPAQCQYAHKLAYLVGEHLVSMPDDALNNRLYYL
eukprot:scpid32449/ scgid34986/ Piwi-like protein 1